MGADAMTETLPDGFVVQKNGGGSFTSEGRPIVPNADGSFSTERSITVTHPGINDGRPTNIPSMFGGVELPEEEAVRRIIAAGGKDPETGRALQGHNSIEEAVSAAQRRSDSLVGEIQGGDVLPEGFTVDQPKMSVFGTPLPSGAETIAKNAPLEMKPGPWETLDDTGRMLASGMMFGYADEISAGMNALLGIGEGETLSERYENNLAHEMRRDEAIREREPAAAFTAELVGGLGTGIPGAGKVMGAKMFQSVPTAFKMAGVGAAGGALAGSGNAPPGQRKEGAIIGGTLGAVIGGVAIPLAKKTVDTAIRKFMASGIGKDVRTAAQQVLRALQRDDLTPDEAFRRISDLAPEGRLIDVGDNTRRLGRAIAGEPSRASKIAMDALETRQEGQGTRLTEAVNRFLDPTGDFAGTADDLTRIRAEDAQPLYDTAYAKVVKPTEKLISLFRRPALEQAWEKARTIAANRGDVLPDNLFMTRPDGGKVVNPDALQDVKLLDYIKRGLDDLVESKRDPVTGKIQGEVQRGIDSLRKQFVAVVDELVPEYKAARSAYAGPSRALEKMNQGRRFIKADEEVTRAQLARMTDDEKFHFRMGAARGLRDIIYSVQDGADAVKRFFGNPLKRERIRAVFDSNEQFDAFRKIMEKETEFYRTRSIVGPFQGSQTQLRQADAADIAGAVSDLAQGNAGTAALRFVRSLLGRNAQGLTPQQAETLAKALFTNDPAVNRKIVQALSMQRFLETIEPFAGAAALEGGRQSGAALAR